MAEALSGATGVLQGTVGGMLNKGSAWLDSIFPPEKRNELMAKISRFATEKPMLASFIASQVALTGFPLGLFAVMTISVVLFALIAGLLIGLLGAVLFIVVAVGFALIILLPILFFTTAAATFIWLWGTAGYYIIKKFNEKKVPGIHTDAKGGVPDSVMGQLDGIQGKTGLKTEPEGEKKGDGEGKEGVSGVQKDVKGHVNTAGKSLNGVTGKVGVGV